MSNDITLTVRTPDVIVEPYRIAVRCGNTEFEVYEHGQRGSGDWAAWSHGSVFAGGTDGYTRDQAVEEARKAARKKERSRLMFEQLMLKLNEREVADDE